MSKSDDDEIADIGGTAGTEGRNLSLGDLDLEQLAEPLLDFDVNLSVAPTSIAKGKASPPSNSKKATRGRKTITWQDDATNASKKTSLWRLSQSTSPPGRGHRQSDLADISELHSTGLKSRVGKSRMASSRSMRLASVVVFSEQDKLLHQNQDETSTLDLSKSCSESDAAAGGEGEQKLSFKDLSLRDVNLIFLMPFFFRIAVHLPFVYFVIQLVEMYEAEMTIVGPLMMGFNLARLVAVLGTMWKPKLCHVAGTAIGCTCYVLLIPFAKTSSIVLFSVCTIAIGLFDASAAVYVYSKEVYGTDMEKMRFAMSYQSATIGVAVIFGFLVGGLMAQYFGTRGIAVFGTIIGLAELLSLASFLIAPPVDSSGIQDEDDTNITTTTISSTVGDGFGKSTTSTTASTAMGGFGKDSIVSAASDDAKKTELLDRYSNSSNIVPSVFTYIVAVIFSFESIVCGNLYSIGPLFIKEQFGIEEGIIGIIFSVGSAAGSLFTFAALSNKGREFQNKYARSPYNLYFLIILGTLSVLGLMIPNFPTQVAMIILVHIALETFLTLMTELQGSITPQHIYAVLGPVAQMSRKILNMVMALTAPMLYKIQVRLPYLFSGSLCVIYTIGFIYLTRRQQKHNAKILTDLFEQTEGVDKEEAKQLVKRYNRMTAASGECLARMAQVAVMTTKRLTKVAGIDMNAIEEDFRAEEEEEEQ